jgi:hypothetical protein
MLGEAGCAEMESNGGWMFGKCQNPQDHQYTLRSPLGDYSAAGDRALPDCPNQWGNSRPNAVGPTAPVLVIRATEDSVSGGE